VSDDLLVIKLGGDAVATPDQIAAAARRVALLAGSRPVIVVTSARRGMTDHLLQLCHDVDRAASGGASAELLVSAHRAVAAGELVTAVLVAAALERLGTRATALDARQAGLQGEGRHRPARLQRIRRTPIRAILARGVVPVVTGFQVAARDDIRILGRGGSDLTAVALAAAFGAASCRFFKLHGLRTADPLLNPQAGMIGTIDYPELHRLLAAGAKVLHHDAARAAERFGLRLEFEEFPGEGPVSVVRHI
jgi:aspartate kinase